VTWSDLHFKKMTVKAELGSMVGRLSPGGRMTGSWGRGNMGDGSSKG
jgi:hypothetical protein